MLCLWMRISMPQQQMFPGNYGREMHTVENSGGWRQHRQQHEIPKNDGKNVIKYLFVVEH